MSKSKGPGPAAYMLPTAVGYEKHNVTKNRRPQYSFGIRSRTKDRNVGPGPAAYNPDKQTRYGRPTNPQFSLAARTRLTERNVGPGPAGYDITGANFKSPRAPAYSIAGRAWVDAKNKNPGPNAYSYGVGFVKPGIPAYSMGRRTASQFGKNVSPGPAAYGAGELSILRNRSPAYTIGARTKMIDRRLGPGPNNYDLKNYKPGDSAPAYSFGIRHGPDASPMVVECDN